MRLRLTIAYLGTRYRGWQLQAGHPDQPSIQGKLEEALGRLAGGPVRVFGSGRTDTGVHAEGQTAHCDIPDGCFRRVPDMRHALNALLPEDIRVFSAVPCAPDFHARVSARAKTYRYRFWQERAFVPPWEAPFVWPCGRLDTGAMEEALPYLRGRHDFASLANTGSDPADTEREIYRLSLSPEPAGNWPACLPGLRLEVEGSGFLRQMVRNMAGLLAYIGQGRVAPSDIPGLLAARKRGLLPSPTAPARGLTLVRVLYPGD